MRLNCYECGKPVTTDLPKQVTIRASLTCPECIEKQLSKEEILEMIKKLKNKLKEMWIKDFSDKYDMIGWEPYEIEIESLEEEIIKAENEK